MAVPNTTNFTLIDVKNELGLGATTGLVACFAAAVDEKFDTRYKGSKNNLLNFRNYRAANNTLSVSPASKSQTSAAFSFTITVTSNTEWAVSDNAAFTTFSPSSGVGNGSISVSGTANGGFTRFSTITVVTTTGSPSVSNSCVIEQAGTGAA